MGCESCSLRTVRLASGLFGGFRVTNKSPVPSGRRCSELTQYDTHTALSLGPDSLRCEKSRQFHDAHTLRSLGIRAASRCKYTSFKAYGTPSSTSRSALLAATPRILSVTSVWVANTTSSNFSVLPAAVLRVTPCAVRSTEATAALQRASLSPSITALTYVLLLPLTTLHLGRTRTSRRWWLTQKRTSTWMGNLRHCLLLTLHTAAHMGSR
mmetsp:Transcript_25158/g.48997  ORF Transcript_25158/g.48997 Transcript_25158/m.48997 type:complete len:211 (-) Transcript_25158:454-1086(-)